MLIGTDIVMIMQICVLDIRGIIKYANRMNSAILYLFSFTVLHCYGWNKYNIFYFKLMECNVMFTSMLC